MATKYGDLQLSFSADPVGFTAVSDARKAALKKLIEMRKEIEALINSLSGDPEHREFVKDLNRGEPVSIKGVRPWDVPMLTAEEIEAKYGITEVEDDTEIPEWARSYGPHHD